MKKVILSMSVLATLALGSCGVDVDKAAEEFCACKDKEGEEQTKCHDQWVEDYKDATGSEEDGQKLAEKMLECDPDNATSVILKLADAAK